MTQTFNLIPVDFDPFGDVKKIEKVIPTNDPQREIWLSCLIGGREANLSYNESVSLQFKGNVSYDALKKSLESVILRHESLRSTISSNGEKLIIYDNFNIDFHYEDISSLTSEKKDSYLISFKHELLNLEFDIYNGPLFRANFHKINDFDYLFTIVQHHIISDGWSTGIILEDIGKFYNAYSKGKIINIEKPAQISDYIVSEIDFEKSDDREQTEKFWLSTYKDNVPVLNLTTDYPRHSPRTYAGNRYDFQLSTELVDKIKSIGAQAGCSLVTTLLAAFEIFLHKETNQNDIVVGLPSAGQSAYELYDLVGHCVNLLPLKSKIDANRSFNDYLNKRKTEVLDAYDYQKLTFGKLVQKLYIPRDPSRITLVPVVFNIDLGMTSAVFFDDLDFTLSSNPRSFEHFEIFLNATNSKKGLNLEWSYNTGLFKLETIKKFNTEYINILEKIIINPFETISKITEKEFSKAFIKGNEIKIESIETFNSYFQKSVKKYNSKIAVSFNSENLTYQELDEKINQLAAFLINKGIKPGSTVALSLDRSMEMLISLLSILKIGAVYLPLDPEYPLERIEFMLEDSGSNFLLNSTRNKGKYNTKAQEIIIEEIWQNLPNSGTEKITINVSGNDLAYILYTSGSTGKPKGVKITHHNLINFLLSMKTTPGIKDTDHLLAITTISFDIAGLELYLPLITGAKLIISNSETTRDGRLLLKSIEDNNITIMQATPSTWQMMLDSGWEKPYDLKILCGGEPINKDQAKLLLSRSSELWNMYGPTETTIWSTVQQIKENEPITIGTAIANTQVYIIDEFGKELNYNEVGEIYIGGDGVAEGYLNRPELTAEKFVSNLYSDFKNTKLYRTGDLGMILANGEIVCLGRIDNQVKIRGHRIELGEIESLLTKQTGIKQAVVLAKEDNQKNKKLAAYLIIDSDLLSLESSDSNQKYLAEEIIKKWKNNLFKELPSYMVPEYFIALDSFPLTPNSKIDRNAFPQIQARVNRTNNNVALTPNEQLIAKIWSNLLDVQNLTPSDDFFELGGHSLIAVKAMVEIEKQIGIRIPIAILFENSTIEKLALQLNKNEFNQHWNSIIPVKNSGKKPPLYIVHGQGMNILMLNTLVNEIDKEQPIFGIQPKGLNPNEEPFYTIEEIASEYVNELINVNPNGPYLIMGYSAGGIIALEMVNRLQKKGKKVSFVGLLDTYYDGPSYVEMLSKSNFKEIFSFTFNSIKYALNFIAKEPRYYLQHNLNFTLGTMYNIYKKINPIKKNLSNPNYVLNKIQNAHLNALNKYKINTINSDVYLFKANDVDMNYIPNSESNGWKPYINGKLNIVDIPLAHLKFFDPLHVSILAEKLQESLNSIEKPTNY